MPLIYRASLTDRYAGRPLRVFDATGTEVDGSPFMLDEAGDYAYSATSPGPYTGSVDNPAVYAGDGTSVVNLVLDEPASIAAGGGGVALDGTPLVIECNAGQELADGLQNIVFDTFGTLTPTTGGAFTLPAGAYTMDWQVNLDEPDAAWTLQFYLTGNTVFADGPRPVLAGTDPSSHRCSGQATIMLATDTEIGGGVRISCDPDAVTPTPLNLAYAVLTLTPFS